MTDRAAPRASHWPLWLRRGPFLCCITVTGEPDVAQNRANTLARDQYRLLPRSDAEEPAEQEARR